MRFSMHVISISTETRHFQVADPTHSLALNHSSLQVWTSCRSIMAVAEVPCLAGQKRIQVSRSPRWKAFNVGPHTRRLSAALSLIISLESLYSRVYRILDCLNHSSVTYLWRISFHCFCKQNHLVNIRSIESIQSTHPLVPVVIELCHANIKANAKGERRGKYSANIDA